MLIAVTVLAVVAGFTAAERRRALSRSALIDELQRDGWQILVGRPAPTQDHSRGRFLNWVAEAMGDYGLAVYIILPESDRTKDDKIRRAQAGFPEALILWQSEDGKLAGPVAVLDREIVVFPHDRLPVPSKPKAEPVDLSVTDKP